MATPAELMQIGQQLAEACQNGTDKEFRAQMYAADCVSAEAVPMPGMDSNEAVGLEAINGKNDWWSGAHELHEMKIQGPFVHGENKISFFFEIDVTEKASGERTQMKEVAQYFVNQDGKIEREEFSYALG